MKWSELPQEYKDLEKKFSNKAFHGNDKKSVDLLFMFAWSHKPQGYNFWCECYKAKGISELPPIEITDYED